MILLPQLFLGLSLAIQASIDRLVLDLGSSNFRIREAASRQLAGIGEPALDILYATKEKHRDPEIRHRAEGVIHTIEDRVYGIPRVFNGHTDTVSTVAFSPDGHLAISGSADGTVRLWDLASGEEVRRFVVKDDIVRLVTFSPKGDRIATVGVKGTIRIWDAVSGREMRRMSKSSVNVNVLCFSPDGKCVLLAKADGSIHLWRTEDGKLLRRFEGHEAPVWAAAFSRDGRRMLSGSGWHADGKPYDCSVRLWDVDTSKELRRFEAHTDLVDGLAVLPHTTEFLSSTDNHNYRELRRWETETGRMVRCVSLRDKVPRAVHLSGIAFSADGGRALTGAETEGSRRGGTKHFVVRFWNTETGAEQARFEGHTENITSVAISANGRQGLSGSYDRTLRLWRLPR